jgi:glycosyltransferase involved in cell wall biosynthesis
MSGDKHIPLVSIVMPVYNAQTSVAKAIQSILDQSFQDFEFIIIDDGSTDQSLFIIRSFSDERIKVIVNEQNEKIVKSLNKGLTAAQGKYIARMDADDISVSQRLEKQVGLMESYPDTVVCGTWYQTSGRKNETVKYPVAPNELRYYALHASPVCHPSAMIRASILKQHHLQYEEHYEYAEDYALWCELLKYGDIRTIPEVLIIYKWDETATYYQQKEKIVDAGYEIRKKLVSYLLPHLSLMRQDELTELLTPRRGEISLPILQQRIALYTEVVSQTPDHPDALKKTLSRNAMYHLHHAAHLGMQVFYLSFNELIEVSFIERIKLFIKCMLKRKA